jgi:hypothetical protein
MGRGLSELQKDMLRRAYLNREAVDTWSNEPSFVYPLPTREMVEALNPDAGRRRSVQAAVSRAVTRLINRGLASPLPARRRGCREGRGRRMGYYAGGLLLTEKGVQVAEELSVNNPLRMGLLTDRNRAM